MSPIERAARAINPFVWGDGPDRDAYRRDAMEKARAVLQAIREPSEGMIDGGRGVHDYDDSCEDNAEAFNRRNVGCIWAAMIDAALQE